MKQGMTHQRRALFRYVMIRVKFNPCRYIKQGNDIAVDPEKFYNANFTKNI